MRSKSLWAVVVCSVLVGSSARGADQPSVKDLVKALSSADKNTSLAAEDALGDLAAAAESAVPALIEKMKDADAEIRWHACRALGSIGQGAAAAVPALTEALGDSDPQVRSYAAFALGKQKKAALPALERLMKNVFDQDPIVRRTSLRALREIDPPQDVSFPMLVKILESSDPAVILPAIQTIAEGGKEAVPKLCRLLEDPKTAHWACVALAEIGPDAVEAVPQLTALLQHADPDVRLQVLLTLGEIGSAAQEAVPQIVEMLKNDAFPHVKSSAAFALAMIKPSGEDAKKALEAALGSDDALVKTVSAWALVRIEPGDQENVRRAVKLLIEALNSSDNTLKSAAARALADLDTKDHPEVAQELIDELDSSDPYVIGNVIDALASHGSEMADSLGPALESRATRKYAARIIFRRGPKAAPAVPTLIAALRVEGGDPDDVEFQRELRLAIGAIGPAAKAAVPELLKSMDSSEFEIRGSSAYALAKIGPDAKEAIPKIREMFRTGDDRLKRLAVWAMLKISPGNPQMEKFAIPLLIKALESDRELARIEAAVTLGELGAVAQPAIEPLKKLLNDPSPAVRAAAEESLKSLQK